MKTHNYTSKVEWTGNEGKGTLNYTAYNRKHTISGEGKAREILGSSDPSFLGDPTKYSPEDLLLSSISSCHMLWYLHLCSINNIVVTSYMDNATAIMEEAANGSGQFKEATLHPKVVIQSEELIQKAINLHHEANKMCFIANSCNFTIHHEAEIVVE